MFDTSKSIKRIVSISAAALCMLSSIRIAPMTAPEADAADDIMTVWEITENMQLGWNLGNTFDAYAQHAEKDANGNVIYVPDEKAGLEAETCWGNPLTTQAMIDAVKAKGFNTIRVPVTWFQHVDFSNGYKIDEAWLARVKEVVDMCYNSGLYVILNMHHEEGWANRPDLGTAYDELKPYFTTVWSQIADTFSDYDQHLIFEAMNEPRAKGTSYEWWAATAPQAECDVINKLNADIVEVIRSTDSPYQETRAIMLPSYCASSDPTFMNANVMPEDDDYLIASVHAYSPYNFTMNDEIEDHTKFTKAYENELKQCLTGVKERFIDNDIPVVIGEFSSSNYGNTEARVSWAETYAETAKAYGFPCVLWDNNVPSDNGGESHGYLNRTECTWYEPSVVVIDTFLDIFNDPTTNWGEEPPKPVIEHEDISTGKVIMEGPFEIDKAQAATYNDSKGIDYTWDLDGKDLAIKYTGDELGVAVSDAEWGGWQEIKAYDIDKENGIAYFSMDELFEVWGRDASEIAHLSVKTYGVSTVEKVVAITAAEHEPTDKTKKYTLDLRGRADDIEQKLVVTFEGAPGSAIEGCVGYMGVEWTNIEYKGTIGDDGKFVVEIPMDEIPNVASAQAQIWWCDDENGEMTSYEIVNVSDDPQPQPNVNYGDANCDGDISLADAILIMQSIGNPDAYAVGGTESSAMTEQGALNADCCDAGNGITNKDALAVQSVLLKLIPSLPMVSQ